MRYSIWMLSVLFFAAASGLRAQCDNLFFSEAAEGSSNNKYLEIYNPTSAAIDLSGYALGKVTNAPSEVGQYDSWYDFSPGAMIAAGGIYVVAHGQSDPAILALADETNNNLSNGDDGFMLVEGIEASYVQIDAVGDWDGDPGSGWEVAGVSNGTKDHTIERKSSVQSGNAGDWITSAGTNMDAREWIDLDQNAWTT